jgi:nitrogen regulatory protein PII
MKTSKKIEIIIAKPSLEELIELLEHGGAKGYTIFKQIIGKGDRGIRDGLGLSDAFENVMVVWLCTDEEFDRLKEEIRALLKESGGMCYMSTVEIMIH